MHDSKVALITGVGRRRSIGATLALGLAHDGWVLVLNYWQPYDDRLGLERMDADPATIADECRALGGRSRWFRVTSATRLYPPNSSGPGRISDHSRDS